EGFYGTTGLAGSFLYTKRSGHLTGLFFHFYKSKILLRKKHQNTLRFEKFQKFFLLAVSSRNVWSGLASKLSGFCKPLQNCIFTVEAQFFG
ncbi:MAG: hypothetical protein Q4E52_12205, partial [Fibrobacter sp.]|nr:hypothetical protein [Fibrobacter sp.]